MIARFGDLLILTVSRVGLVTNIISFCISLSLDKQLFYEHEFKFTNLKFCKITNKINE